MQLRHACSSNSVCVATVGVLQPGAQGVLPHHDRGLSVLVALIGTVEIFGLIAQAMGHSGAFWTWISGLNINTFRFAIMGLVC
jgi:hypothetical protein